MPSELPAPIEAEGSPREQYGAGRRSPTDERWFDALVEPAPTAIGVICALENRYVRANAAMVDLYGVPLEELLNTDPFSLAFRMTHPDDLVAEQKLFAELVAGARRSYQFEKRFVRPDGTVRWGLLTMSALFAPSADPAVPVGPLSGVTILIVDTTERKALEAALARREGELRHAQKVDALGRLSAGIAHDFNNLLTVITGHGQVLKESLSRTAMTTRSGPDPAEDVEAILAASERAAGLTAQLLAHGRRGPSPPRAFLLSELAGSQQRMLARTLGSHVELEHTLTATGAIFADEGQVGQVVMNLVLNARDALADGGRIRLETRDLTLREGASEETPGPGEWVALVVSDDGHGMSAEVKARMFEPFFTTRGDRPGIQGSGLGLAVVQRIVTEARGHIAVDSTPGRGTTVSVFFPRVAAPTHDLRPAAPLRAGPAPNSRRVLVVEDDPAVRALIGTVLLGAHYRVAVARHGEEGLDMLESTEEPFHLVVTDLMMPRMGGAELARTLRLRGASPHILFISGHGDHTPGDLRPYGSLLPKPFTPSQLLSAVADALGPEPAALQPR
jgi:two-component system, cell cycle sensor histidine kinase and response regulator CckA